MDEGELVVDIENELRAAIEDRVAGLVAATDLAGRARRGGRHRRRVHSLAVAAGAAVAVGAVAAIPVLTPSTQRTLPAVSPVRTVPATPKPSASNRLCGPGTENLPGPSPQYPAPRLPIPGFEVTYLPPGFHLTYVGTDGHDPQQHSWTYGATYSIGTGSRTTGFSVRASCGPAASLKSMRGIFKPSDVRTTVVHGKPAIRHGSRPVPGSMGYDVIWLERPGASIWVETSTNLGSQLDAIINGIKITG
jgi:hypothetical protein